MEMTETLIYGILHRKRWEGREGSNPPLSDDKNPLCPLGPSLCSCSPPVGRGWVDLTVVANLDWQLDLLSWSLSGSVCPNLLFKRYSPAGVPTTASSTVTKEEDAPCQPCNVPVPDFQREASRDEFITSTQVLWPVLTSVGCSETQITFFQGK